nr:VOC family protein [uncultured Sphingomonas sp.]
MTDGPMIFVNLPVSDLNRSIAFYEAIGATKEPKFSNDDAAMMKFSDIVNVMLLTHDHYKQFTPKPIADAHKSSAVLIALTSVSRDNVDVTIDRAEKAGGKADIGPKQEFGDMMYGRSFEDPDGHHWEIVWMDPAAAEQGASAMEQA